MKYEKNYVEKIVKTVVKLENCLGREIEGVKVRIDKM